MHPQFAQLTVTWFRRAFVYTGSIGEFRYRFACDEKEKLIHAAVYSDVCYELALDKVEQDFSWDGSRRGADKGLAARALRAVSSPAGVTLGVHRPKHRAAVSFRASARREASAPGVHTGVGIRIPVPASPFGRGGRAQRGRRGANKKNRLRAAQRVDKPILSFRGAPQGYLLCGAKRLFSCRKAAQKITTLFQAVEKAGGFFDSLGEPPCRAALYLNSRQRAVDVHHLHR